MPQTIRRRKDRPPRTDAEVLSDAQRFVRAMGRRVKNPSQFMLLYQGVGQALAEAEREAVDQLRANGFTNARIGESLGMSERSVRRRWPRR